MKDEYDNVKDNLKNVKKSKGYNRTKNAIHDVADLIGGVLLAILKVILIIIGVSFILAGFAILISFIGVFFFKHSFFIPTLFDTEMFYFPDFLQMWVDPANVPLIMIALVLTICIPLLALIYGGIKLIFRFKANDKVVGLFAFVLWFLSTITLLAFTFFEGVNYSENARLTSSNSLTELPSDTLYLKLNENYPALGYPNDLRYDVDDVEIIASRQEDKFYCKPTFDIERSESDDIILEVIRRSQGKTRRMAADNAKTFVYQWEVKDSILYLDHFFSLPEGEKWRMPEMDLTLKIPEGFVVHIGDEMDEIIHDIRNRENVWDFDMVDKMWIMTEYGLSQLDKN